MSMLVVVLALGAIVAVLGIGVGVLLYQDRREEQRMARNGGRRF